ncbi:MAG TPA: ATP-binding protein [Chthoniobacterales bacterium]
MLTASQQLKPLNEWSLDYILGLSSDECDWLDFKASDWLKPDGAFSDKVSKYLSAWANYDGGYLVIGIQDVSASKTLTLDRGVDLNMKGGIQEWLEAKLPSLVDEPLQKISTRTFPIPSDPMRGVVVIHVPASNIAPHQATDRKFYARLGSHLSPLHKRAITDILNRQKHPELRADVKLVLIDPDINEKSALICHVYNDSDVFCLHACVDVRLPLQYKTTGIFFPDGFIDTDSNGRSCWVVRVKNGINAPLFPRSDRVFRASAKYGVSLKDEKGDKLSIEPTLTTLTYADGAPPRVASYDFEALVSIRPYKALK